MLKQISVQQQQKPRLLRKTFPPTGSARIQTMPTYLILGKSFNLLCASVFPSCSNEPAHTGAGSELMASGAGPVPALRWGLATREAF